MDEENNAISLGEELVGLTFNPSGNNKVAELKTLFAKAIDIINENNNTDELGDTIDQTAIAEIITAQMWAVKAITWKAS